MNGWTQTFGADRDRAVGRVENGVRVDPGGLVDAQPVGRADQRERGQVAIAHPDFARGLRSRGRVVAVPGDEVPGAVDPLAADLLAAMTGRACRRTSRRRRCGSSATASSGPTRAQAGLAVAEAHPGGDGARRAEADGGHPPAVGDDHAARGPASRGR